MLILSSGSWSVFGAEHLGALESIDPSKQIAIIEHYLYILGHLESIDPSICISLKLPSSALEMLVPGHAVGNVMGRGRANVDNIRKYDQDYFLGKRKRGKDYKEGMLRGTEVTLKGLKRKDVQLLRKFGIQFKGGFENAEVGGDPKDDYVGNFSGVWKEMRIEKMRESEKEKRRQRERSRWLKAQDTSDEKIWRMMMKDRRGVSENDSRRKITEERCGGRNEIQKIMRRIRRGDRRGTRWIGKEVGNELDGELEVGRGYSDCGRGGRGAMECDRGCAGGGGWAMGPGEVCVGCGEREKEERVNARGLGEGEGWNVVGDAFGNDGGGRRAGRGVRRSTLFPTRDRTERMSGGEIWGVGLAVSLGVWRRCCESLGCGASGRGELVGGGCGEVGWVVVVCGAEAVWEGVWFGAVGGVVVGVGGSGTVGIRSVGGAHRACQFSVRPLVPPQSVGVASGWGGRFLGVGVYVCKRGEGGSLRGLFSTLGLSLWLAEYGREIFHILNITIDQVMLRAFPMSLTGAASRWLRNKPSGLITTWEDLKTKFLSKYCPPARTAKKMEEINNFQQEPDENLYQAWERTLDEILDSRGAIPSKTAADAKKVNEKVYAAQVGCKQCKGPHYTKDYTLNEEGKTLKEAYYTQFGAPFQEGGYRATAPGCYQRNNANPSDQEQRQSIEDTLSKFMSKSAKIHEENSNLIKEI
ncbi:uncharacterized mitochondrial protein-like protein [Tanacetum coccineum]